MAFRVTRASVTTDPGLEDIASLEASAGDIIVASGVDDYSLQSTTTAGRTVLALASPGADQIAFWDYSASAFGWLTLGSGLSITGTTLDIGVGSGDLGALESLSGTGIAARIGTDTWVQRTITGTAEELTVTNGDGVSGNPTISLPSAITLATKTVTGGTFNNFGVSGSITGDVTVAGTWTFTNPQKIEALAPNLRFSATGAAANEKRWRIQPAAAGTFSIRAYSDDEASFTNAIFIDRTGTTIDEIEFNATAIDVNATMDVSGALTVASVAVPTISSSDTLSNKTLSSPTISGTVAGTPAIASAWAFSTSPTVPTPTNSTDAANKAYVDSVAVGLSVKTAVACATTANITLSGEQTIDGIATSASRVLVKDQSTASQNGIYVSAAGAWSRATDMDVWTEAIGALVSVTAGTVNANRIYVSTAAAGGTIGTTSLTFTLFISTSGLQPLDSDLTAIAALTTTSYGRSLLEAANAAALRTLAGTVIGTDVQAYSAVLAATTASFLTADETKLDGIEALADVTDATNVAAAGALMTSSLAANVATFLGTPSSTNLRAALTDETGTGSAVFATSPTLVTPALGTPSALTLTNATGLPISTGVSGLGSNVATFLATPSSANLRSAITDETGTGSLVFDTSPTLVTPALGTPSSAVLTNATGLPVATGISGLGTGVATFLATPSSANLATAVTDETGSGALVFGTSPTLATPSITSPTIAGATFSGTLAGTPTFSGVITFTATTGPLISSTAPRLRFYETDAATDEKEWAILTNGGLFTIFPYDDAGGAGSTAAVRINRTGTVVDEVELNATALDFNGALDLSGAAVFGSTASFAGAVTASTTIELGNTSDTTLSRASAGQVAIEGVQVATISNAVTLTNKSVTATGSSTARTLESRFAEQVNVKDFGATGDNSTDDTSAINAAIAYAQTRTFKTLYFPTGKYRVTASLTAITGGQWRVFGDGVAVSIIRFTMNDDCFTLDVSATSSFFGEICDLAIEGDVTGTYSSAVALRVLASSGSATGASYWRFRRLRFRDVYRGLLMDETGPITSSPFTNLSAHQFNIFEDIEIPVASANAVYEGLAFDKSFGVHSTIKGGQLRGTNAAIRIGTEGEDNSVGDFIIDGVHVVTAGVGIMVYGPDTTATNYNQNAVISACQFDNCTTATTKWRYMQNFAVDLSNETASVGHDIDSTNKNYWVEDRSTVTYSSDTKSEALKLRYTDAGATAGPFISTYRDSASPAASDLLGGVRAYGMDSGGNETLYAEVAGQIVDTTNGSEDGRAVFRTVQAGTLATRGYVENGLVVGSPTGSDKGAGTVNAQRLYEAGAGVSTVLANSAAAVSVSATTSEETLATVTIPAGAMGANGWVEIEHGWTMTNGADDKTPRVYFGATPIYDVTQTTQATTRDMRIVMNRNSQSSQVLNTNYQSNQVHSVSTSAFTTATIDTSAAVDITFKGQKETAGNTLTLEWYRVMLHYRA